MQQPFQQNPQQQNQTQNNSQQPRTNSNTRSQPIKKRSKRFFLTSFLFAVFIIGLTWWILSTVSSRLTWKAVFLDSNQVYFGRFNYVPFLSTVTLHDVHYLRPLTDADIQTGTSTEKIEGDLSVLSILGDVHSPKDSMIINKNHILYYQEIRPDSVLFRGLSESIRD